MTAFHLRKHEGFVYVYDFNAWWRREMRLERRMLRQRTGQLPRCGPCPPEDICGIERYLEASDEHNEYEFLDWSLREGPIVLEHLRDQVALSTCGAQLARKGHHHLVFRSAFGRLSIDQGVAWRQVAPVARLPLPALRRLESLSKDLDPGEPLCTRTTCYKSGLPCSITCSGLTLNDGIRPFPEEMTNALPL
ncbi:hypothetical protein AWV79_37025 [Cupriavidus sp. UYMMa02A]|nr:hypothetical protein AWV79_37025 [Cupriavidus sp. UYMMa02A]